MSQLSIKITIAGRTYPLSINMSEEERIRKAAKTIDENLSKLQQSYAVKDKQDLLAMTALQMGVEKMTQSQNDETESLTIALTDLNGKILKHI
ncbi:MAG: cell division protein ZapA (FtsZ GTPase activity inhibitor) [Flavobacteriales bacterium]|jgi:cell division protein ZapA (FtsZ GTPase activity inhibitor)